MPGRGGPLCSWRPGGAWKTLDWNGQRLGSNWILRVPVSDSQTTCSSGAITTISGSTPTRTSFSAIDAHSSGATRR